ncbi:MAG: hypothetical protein ACQES9_13535, partial [Myxococcota bacterium]
MVQQVTQYFTSKLNAEFSVKSVDYTLFNKIILNDVYIADQQGDSLIHSKEISGHLNYLDLKNRQLFFRNLQLDSARIRIYNDTSRNINIKFLVEALKRKDTTKQRMHLKFNDLNINHSHLKYLTNKPAKEDYGVDMNRLNLKNFNLSLSKLEADDGWVNLQLNNIAFIDKSGFEVLNMNSEIFIDPAKTELQNIKFQTPYSYLEADSIHIQHNGYENFNDFVNKVSFSLGIKRSNLGFNDLAYFAKPFQGLPKNNVVFEGNLKGKIKNLRGKGIYIALGDQTELKTDFSADGLPEIQNTFLYIDIDELNTGVEDINLIQNLTGYQKPIEFPEGLKNLGRISYTGNFTGFTEDFVAYGTLTTNLGQLSTDVSIVPKKNEEFKINGNIQTKDFDISGLANNSDRFGALSMDIQINGTTKKDAGFETSTDGIIQKLEVNNYNYKNIKLDGLLTNKKYDGVLAIEDPNVNFEFSGGIDFSQEIPVFDFEAKLYEAKLQKLNFVDDDTTATLSVNLISNFEGNNLDNAEGIIQFNKGRLIRNGKRLNFDNLKIDARHQQDSHAIFLHSDYIDGSLTGKYHSTSVHQSLKNLFYSYMPVFIKNPSDTAKVKIKNNFELNIDFKDTEKVTEVLFPEFQMGNDANFNLSYKGFEKSFDLTAHADEFGYKYYHFKDLNLTSRSQDSIFSLIFNFNNLKFNPKEKTTYLNNYTLKSLSGNNKSKILIDWDDPDQNSTKGEFIALIDFLKATNSKNIITKIFFLPGILNVQDEDWHFAKSTITIDTSSIKIDNLKFQHEHQKFLADGRITNNPEDTLNLNFSEIDLKYANLLFPSGKFNIEGIINGDANLSDLYGKPTFQSDLDVDSLVFNDQVFGHTNILSQWNSVRKNIWIDVESKRGNLKTIDFEGNYTPNSQLLDFDLTLDKLRLDFLNPILEKTFSDMQGNLSGHLTLQGTTDYPVFNGKLIAHKSAFTIDYLQTRYNFTDVINVSSNKLIFDNVAVYDKQGNQSIVDGNLFFEKLKNISYNFK